LTPAGVPLNYINTEEKILQYPERLSDYKEMGFAQPINAEVDLTNRCSLKCKGCMSAHMRNADEMDIDQISRVIEQLVSVECLSVTWTGGGEPLENENWRYAMEAASLAGFDQGLYSYLPSMTQPKVDFMDKHLKFVVGHNTAAWVTHTGERDCVWSCNWLLDSTNYKRIPEFIDKTNFQLFDHAYFRPLIMEGENYSWVAEAITMLRLFGNNPKVKWSQDKFADLLHKRGERTYKKCFSTAFTVSIGADGTVWECLNRRGITPWGNIFEKDLEDILGTKEPREDFTGCRILCRNHGLNKTLWKVFGTPPEHGTFV
jgi:hypothetical protein